MSETFYELSLPHDGRGQFVMRVIRCNCVGDPEKRITYDDEIEILRADDVVLIADELVERWNRGQGASVIQFGDGMVTIRGRNCTVTYGLISKDLSLNAWVAMKSPEVIEDIV